MRISSFVWGRKTALFFSMSMPIIVLLMFNILSVSVIHAANGQPAFQLEPVMYDAHNPVTKSYFVMNGRPGVQMRNSIRVTNSGAASGTVTLYPVDALTGNMGGTSFHVRRDARSDVGAWIKLSRQTLDLAPGQSQTVPFQVTVPEHVSSGQHVGGIVAENMEEQAFTSKSVPLHLLQLRIVAVQVNLPGTSIEKIVATGIQPGDANPYQRLVVGLHNTGNMMVQASGNLQISDLNGHPIQTRTLQLGTFLPQTSIKDPVYIQHHALPIGRYKAVLTLNYGHQQRLSYATIVEIRAQKKTLANAVSTLVTLGDGVGFFSMLAPWQIAVGAGILLLLLGGLSFWLYKLSTLLIQLYLKRKKSEVV